MTEKCSIGLVAKSSEPKKNYLLFLGEIKEKDEKLLYVLHKELRFLCKFNASIVDSSILLDNAEEILAFQKKYNIEPKISVTGVVEEKSIQLLAPELYDITCMVPLFSDKVMRNVKPICNSKSKVFFTATLWLMLSFSACKLKKKTTATRSRSPTIGYVLDLT